MIKLKGKWEFAGFKPEGCMDLPDCHINQYGFLLRTIDKKLGAFGYSTYWSLKGEKCTQ